MTELYALEPYEDERGNVIVFEGRYDQQITVIFRGSNNRLVVSPDTAVKHLRAVFDRDNGTLVMGNNLRAQGGNWAIRIGQDSTITIGDDVSTTGRCSVSACEGVDVVIGDDVMISTDVKIRADDGHPIFDVRTGKRVNPTRPITIGSHVWLGWGSTVLGGSTIGGGSVIGTRAVVTGKIPNNCTAAGIPARVLRRDVVWERPHLSFDWPPYKPDISVMRKHKSKRFWNLTERPVSVVPRRLMAKVAATTAVVYAAVLAVLLGRPALAWSWPARLVTTVAVTAVLLGLALVLERGSVRRRLFVLLSIALGVCGGFLATLAVGLTLVDL